MTLLHDIAAGKVVTSADLRSDLRRLAHEDLILAGFGIGHRPMLLPRGERLLA
jgi:hypothetical protein